MGLIACWSIITLMLTFKPGDIYPGPDSASPLGLGA